MIHNFGTISRGSESWTVDKAYENVLVFAGQNYNASTIYVYRNSTLIKTMTEWGGICFIPSISASDVITVRNEGNGYAGVTANQIV